MCRQRPAVCHQQSVSLWQEAWAGDRSPSAHSLSTIHAPSTRPKLHAVSHWVPTTTQGDGHLFAFPCNKPRLGELEQFAEATKIILCFQPTHPAGVCPSTFLFQDQGQWQGVNSYSSASHLLWIPLPTCTWPPASWTLVKFHKAKLGSHGSLCQSWVIQEEGQSRMLQPETKTVVEKWI